ncbi:MAG: ABC transporter substrate-binding protein [Dehalococcoidia bacterium]
MTRRRFIAGSGVMAAGSAAILAGCGDDDDDDGGSTPAATGTAASTGTAAATGTATSSAAKPVKGGTLKLFKAAADTGQDPRIYHQTNPEVLFANVWPATWQVSKNKIAFDGMLSMEQVDPTTVVFKVRPGMKFSNGDPITAEDWAYTMTSLPVITKERRGHASTPLFNYIESTTAVDATTVRQKLTRPNPSHLVGMTYRYMAFLNKKVIEAGAAKDGQPTKDAQDNPAGAFGGPYNIDKREATGTKLVRNPNYWKHEPADDGFVVDGPYIDNVEYRIIPDRAAQKAAFAAGDIDVLGGIDKLEADEFKSNKNLSVAEKANGAWNILAFDHKKLFDKRARAAIRAAINYDAFGAAIFAGPVSYNAPVNILIPGWQAMTQDQIKAYHKYDPADAKKLWEAAGKPVSKIRILSYNNATNVSISDFVAQNLKSALGVDVEVQQADPQAWAQRANVVPDKDWELLQSGNGLTGGTSGVPENSNLIWYDPRAYGPLAFNASIDSDNPTIKEESTKILELLKAQEIELDVAKRKQMLTDLQKYLFDIAHTGALLPIAKNALFAYNSRLQDFGLEDWDNGYALRRHAMWLKA